MKRAMLCLMAAVILLTGLVVPAQAASALDTYATGKFKINRLCAVYSGPSEKYVRANSGKAAYGGGECRIYGMTGDWYMIGYGMTNGGFRIGYIHKRDISKIYGQSGNINYNLTFQPYTAYARSKCRVTDDPVIKNETVYTVPKNTAVTVLCTYGKSWTYVEVQTSTGPMRGFVQSDRLKGGVTPEPTPKPKRTPTPTPTPTYYYPIYPTATPTSGSPNTYYHPSTRSVWLPTSQTVRLKGSWPVYSGPGTYYFRANNNKATMGGGLCEVYGREGNWVLIGYGLTNGNYRIGYLSVDAIPQMGLAIPYLDFQATTRYVKYTVDLTDDPVRYRPAVVTLYANTSLLVLGYVYESGETWAYVEVQAAGSIMRGFVPTRYLQ